MAEEFQTERILKGDFAKTWKPTIRTKNTSYRPGDGEKVQYMRNSPTPPSSPPNPTTSTAPPDVTKEPSPPKEQEAENLKDLGESTHQPQVEQTAEPTPEAAAKDKGKQKMEQQESTKKSDLMSLQGHCIHRRYSLSNMPVLIIHPSWQYPEEVLTIMFSRY